MYIRAATGINLPKEWYPLDQFALRYLIWLFHNMVYLFWIIWVGCTLTWSRRMKIALDAAKGLAFLHGAERPIIYRGFKTSNILLDAVSYNFCIVFHKSVLFLWFFLQFGILGVLYVCFYLTQNKHKLCAERDSW